MFAFFRFPRPKAAARLFSSAPIVMKPLVTAADLERVPQNGEVAVTPDTIITPLARDDAERRGITFRTCVAPGTPSRAGGARRVPSNRKNPRAWLLSDLTMEDSSSRNS